MKIVTIVGARPQFIKAASISREIAKFPELTECIIHTGQHYDDDMSSIFFEQMQIPQPKYQLSIGSHLHGKQTGIMLEKLEQVFLDEKPDWVLIYGDTNSTLAGALAAAKLHIRVAHVESGLRSFNREMPEEINRVIADQLSTILFAPTPTAITNLQNEGIVNGKVHHVGDVMYDCALFYGERAENYSQVNKKLGLKSKEYILATIHRAENTDNLQRLTNSLQALDTLAASIPVILPLHPRTKKMQAQYGITTKNIRYIEPLGYFDMLMLERGAKLIVTDSGGVQKEAFFQQVPCVTLRDETEWVELIELGWNRLASPSSAEHMLTTIQSALTDPLPEYEYVYGKGDACAKIVNVLRTTKQ